MPLIVTTSKMEWNKVIPLVLDTKIVIFDFKSIPPCLQQWLPIISETSKSLVLNLSQHGLQIASDI